MYFYEVVNFTLCSPFLFFHLLLTYISILFLFSYPFRRRFQVGIISPWRISNGGSQGILINLDTFQAPGSTCFPLSLLRNSCSLCLPIVQVTLYSCFLWLLSLYMHYLGYIKPVFMPYKSIKLRVDTRADI